MAALAGIRRRRGCRAGGRVVTEGASVEPSVVDPLQAGRDAVRRNAWREALDLLRAADGATALSPEDLEGLAEAAWWSGLLASCIDARERAYKLYIDSGRPRRAGFVALGLARDYFGRQEGSIAKAWLSRAERLLADETDCSEKAWLLRMRAIMAIEGEHDFAKGLDHATRALEMATRVQDRDVMALALHDQGRALVAAGKVAAGMELMDEATVAAVGGELSAWVTAAIYCNMITACQQLADVRRAGEWTQVAKRWCERQAIAGFPGMCRVYRAEIMRLRGAWREAEEEARRACEELKEFNLGYCAAAFYEVGEIRLHAGDLTGAEEAFRHAHGLGRDPQPGLALLRLAEGKPVAALRSIRAAVAAETRERLVRVRLLSALVEIAIAAHELDAAGVAVEELAAIARDYGTPALNASALSARAALLLARGESAEALPVLRESLRTWTDLDAPFEAARTRLVMAEAHRRLDDPDSATLELEAARTVFERLGARRELARAAELRAQVEGGHPSGRGHRAEAVARADRTFVFTDIVKSTALVEAMGDEAWAGLVRWHDQTLRGLIARHGGEEVDHAGDGFFIAFVDAAPALDRAVAIQRALAEHRRDHGFAPQVRIGVHTSVAIHEGGKYKGKGVHEAARIGALAGGGEIVVSERTIAEAHCRAGVTDPRTVPLKGISEPVTVYTLSWGCT
jgi:class 3 adenylate cyclase